MREPARENMPAQCANGSQPKSGAPAWTVYESADVTTLLGAAGGWLPLWVLGLPPTPLEVATFCATEPTGDLPTTADYAALAFPPLALLTGTYQRFANQLVQDKWNTLCECAPLSTANWDLKYHNCSTQVYSGSGDVPAGVFDYDIRTGDAQYRAWGYQAAGCASTQGYICVDELKADGTPAVAQICLGNSTFVYTPFAYPITSSVPHLGPTNINAATTKLRLHVFNYNPSTTACCASGALEVNGTAAPLYTPPGALTPPTGFPDPPASGTCTTEQDVCNSINSLKNDLALTQTFLRVLQSQVAPFGYQTGVSHTGLTGNGQFAVSGILGVAVELTHVPSSWGQTAATPRRLYPQVGEIHFANNSYDGAALPLHYDDELFLAPPPLTTFVVYSLRSGITATITELLRS